jgi:integrase
MPRRNRLDTITYFTPDELKRLFAVITSKRDKAIFLIGYRHGLRASEIGMLHITDLDFKRLRIKCNRKKGSFSGEHPFEADEVRIVKAYLKERKEHHRLSDNPLLFPSNRGTPISQQRCKSCMRQP